MKFSIVKKTFHKIIYLIKDFFYKQENFPQNFVWPKKCFGNKDQKRFSKSENFRPIQILNLVQIFFNPSILIDKKWSYLLIQIISFLSINELSLLNIKKLILYNVLTQCTSIQTN